MLLPIQISQESREPIYHQIGTQIKALISSGYLPVGTSLPSIRALAKDLQCSVITTKRAYQDLEHEHFIKTVQGKGTFVAEVGLELKEEIKQKTVREALNKAIDIGLQHDYKLDDLIKMFEVAIEERRK
ncbi:GntR family transcriptional regulator [Bacillus carboniphilus]|uniref:GntR family transcriptional regulator n=1 Tax=Bacillus carboniphilus TaxID=86663 RepID=A0ABN0W726_9BACI